MNEIKKDENGNISSPNSAWFLLKLSKMDINLDRYKIHQGEIIKIGRIVTRIREIKFDKNKKNENNNNKNNNSKNEASMNNSNFMLKDIDNQILIQKKDTNINLNYDKKIMDLANQRNATDSDLNDKVQILNLNDNKNKNDSIININDNNTNIANYDNNDTDTIKYITKTISSQKTISSINNSNKKKKEKICRVCYMEEEDEKENPILQPCHCSGSCKYIHLQCLKHWIMNKSCLKVDQNDYCSVFVFTESECELCKAKLPDFVSHHGKLISLLDFSDEFKNYLILESLTLDKENNKFLYIISLNKSREIRVGRGQFCDILLSDVSVSRIHCILVVEGKNIYIQDNDSKFGTLILIQTPTIKLLEDLPFNVQVGRSYFHFLIKKETKFFGCCGVSENPNLYYYYRLNEKQIESNRVFTVKNENENDDDDEEDEKKSSIRHEKKRSDIEEYINEIVI